MINYQTDPQKIAFDRLFNAKMYNHYGSNDGWVTARQIDVNRNTLKALVRQGLAEVKEESSWYPANRFWYRLK
jgi:hypothetical protein